MRESHLAWRLLSWIRALLTLSYVREIRGQDEAKVAFLEECHLGHKMALSIFLGSQKSKEGRDVLKR